MNNEEGLTARQFILQRGGKDYGFCFILPMFDAFKTLRNAPAREHSSSLNVVVGVTHGIREIQRFALLKDAYYDMAMDVFGRSLPGVYELRRNEKRFLESEGYVAFHEFEPHPSPFVNLEGFSTLPKCGSGDPALPYHLTPYRQRYEGIDTRCHDRSYGRLSYTLLGGVLLFGLGVRIPYRLIVKGDNRAYFIPWQILTPLYFLFIMAGFGLLLDCVLYFANPCLDVGQEPPYSFYQSHGNTVTQKYLLTSPNYCITVMCIGRTNMANVLSTEKQVAIISGLAEGSSIRSLERITGVHRDTITRLGVRVGQGCQSLLDAKMRDLSCQHLQFDELWGFIGKKEKHVRPDGNPTLGDVWTFCAIDSETKLVPSFKVGKRDRATANAFVSDVASRMANRVQISTDGLRAYVEAVEQAFGSNVDYAQIVKVFDNDSMDAEVIGMDKTRFTGRPDMSLASTSHVERLNGTTRLHMRRLTRLTYAFSKKLENFEAAVGLHFAYYNFVKRHITLRATPAMAAGIERDFWTVADLVEATA